MRPNARWLDLALLCCVACQPSTGPGEPRGRAGAASTTGLSQLLAPPRAGAFSCRGELCTQPYPRLPDTGEWRCADSGHVVWCAGGEPAAGVVPSPGDPGYRCGRRFGVGRPERICIDEHPDYPPDGRDHYACSFAQERGMSRICRRGSAIRVSPLPRGALPACWLGKDCRSGECDRGACRCKTDQDCERGACRLEMCVGVSP